MRGSCSYTIVLPSPCSSTFGSIMPVSGMTLPSSFSAYAIARQSGWHGTGITSLGLKTGDCCENLLADFAERQAIASRDRNPPVARPPGSAETSRRARSAASSAKSMISPISSSFNPFFSVTTSVVEMLCSLSRSSARRRMSRQILAAQAASSGSACSESNCR